jgi:hypothetical protein
MATRTIRTVCKEITILLRGNGNSSNDGIMHTRRRLAIAFDVKVTAAE